MQSTTLYDWDEALQGFILSSFYIGYVLTHVPGGVITSKYGAKYTLLAGMSLSAMFTILTPVITEAGGSTALIISRIIVGLGEGIVFPGCASLLSSWSPKSERGKMVTITYSGAQMGSIFGSLVSGVLLDKYAWSSVFYFFGAFGVAWVITFVSVYYYF